MFFLSFAIVAAARANEFNSLQFRASAAYAVAIVSYSRVLRGDRGGSLGIFVTLALVFYMSTKKPTWQKNMLMLVAAVVLFGFLQVWAPTRAEAQYVGVWSAFTQNLGNAYPDLLHPLAFQLLPQAYWHLLHVIDLYTLGISLHGHILSDLALQSIPSFIADVFHYVRPLNGAWLLAKYRSHSGGMYVIAEGFWNFGMAGSLLVTIFLATVVVKLESWYRKQEPLLSCTYFAFLGTFGVGLFYGLQPLIKSLELSLIIAWSLKTLARWQRKKITCQLTQRDRLNRAACSMHFGGRLRVRCAIGQTPVGTIVMNSSDESR